MSGDTISVTILSEDKIYAAWKLSKTSLDFVITYFKKHFQSFRQALRLYEITDIHFNGNNAHNFHEFMMPENQNHWILKGINPDRYYCLEFGIHLTETEFFPLLRSTTIHTSRSNFDKEEHNEKRLKSNPPLPKWTENVSTYSYYETVLGKEDEK